MKPHKTVHKPNAGIAKAIKKRTGGQRVQRHPKMTNIPEHKIGEEGKMSNIPEEKYKIS